MFVHKNKNIRCCPNAPMSKQRHSDLVQIFCIKQKLWCIMSICFFIAGSRKSALFVFPSHKIIVKKFVNIKNPFYRMTDQLGGVEPIWDCSVCRADCPCPSSSAQLYLSDMWREPYLLSPEEQFLSTQCCCHSVFWHTDSQNMLTLFLGCHYACFWLCPLAS